jgi:hypothetical protein
MIPADDRVTVALVADSLYFGPDRSGVPWLLDPAAPGLAGLARAVQIRTQATQCEPEAVAADLSALPELLRERHFGIAAGLVAEASAAEAERLILTARDRIVSARPRSWGEALGDLNDQLRICLRDRHVQLGGSAPSRIRCDEPVATVDENAPVVEVEVQHGVLTITIRRLWGGQEDDARLWEWARDSLGHFSHERIIVDLRGNPGGNDMFMLEWIRPVLRAGASIPGAATGWFVGDAPLGLWNPTALIEARDGLDAIPSWHREHRRAPSPGDVLQIRTESDDELPPAGVRPWEGKMLVLVDGQTGSSGESSAWMLQHALGGLLLGGRTAGKIEYGNIAPYLLPASGLYIGLPTKRNDFGIPVELVGLPVHAALDPRMSLSAVAASFDRLYDDVRHCSGRPPESRPTQATGRTLATGPRSQPVRARYTRERG